MKRLTKRQLRVLQSKINPMNSELYRTGSYWSIHGTPTEILILVDRVGIKDRNRFPYNVKWIRENHKQQGESSPRWFYFHISHKKLNHRFKELQNESK